MKVFLVLCLGLFLGSQPNDLQLKDFVFSQEMLPEGCSLKNVGTNDRLPCNAEGNPFISSDRAFLDCFAGKMVGNKDLSQKIEQGLFSVYEGTAEMGVFGLQADTEETAQQVLAIMEGKSPNDEGVTFMQSGRIVIILWRDRGKTDSYDALKKLIEGKME